jgi:hypothetical protein
MKLGTHMPDGERRKPIDIEVCRTKVCAEMIAPPDAQTPFIIL